MEPFLGMIAYFGFTFTPRGWHECDGTLLPISQYTALFALLGPKFGGDGRTNFALPKITPMKTETGDTVKAYIALEGIFPPRD